MLLSQTRKPLYKLSLVSFPLLLGSHIYSHSRLSGFLTSTFHSCGHPLYIFFPYSRLAPSQSYTGQASLSSSPQENLNYTSNVFYHLCVCQFVYVRIHVHVYVSVYACTWHCLWRLEYGIGTEASGDCKLASVGSANQTPVLCKSSKWS